MKERRPGPPDIQADLDRMASLIRSNERLRAEAAGLRSSCQALALQVEHLSLGTAAERHSRRAALNLMEDAIQARMAEHRENEERRRVEAELREADRRKDEFLATLAHELRGPLAPLRHALAVLREGVDPATAKDLHGVMDRQVQHLARLVDDLLDVSRITRGRIELRKERVDVAAVVAAAVDATRRLLDAAAHHLEIVGPERTVAVDADPVRLVQVLTNVLANAAKFTDPGGHVRVHTRTDGREVIISVADDGIGIPTHLLPQVFDAFTQLGAERPRSGLGIGLTLARALVELHGGSIEAYSGGVGLGSEFCIRLPLAEDRPEAPAARAPAPVLRGRVLVVDDNEDTAQTLALYLGLLGADVQVVHDGPAALAALHEFRPAAVLLDIGMPGMDGHEVARRARATPEGRDATLIALTGWGQSGDRARSREAGFDHHLVKPVDLEALVSLLSAK